MGWSRRTFLRGVASVGGVAGVRPALAQHEGHQIAPVPEGVRPTAPVFPVPAGQSRPGVVPVVTPDVPDMPWRFESGAKVFNITVGHVRTEFIPGRVVDVHCAQCHANDGSGAEMGKAMFPPTPDMRAEEMQSLSDGALFYTIEHGVRFTGMPSFTTGTPEGEESSWHLVNFIRHLPKLTLEQIEEMAAMNPRPPAEIRQEIEAERFLRGEEAEPAAPSHGAGGH